jgi:metal-responsive CopG/Arc/MetJ family transcriptional regulator
VSEKITRTSVSINQNIKNEASKIAKKQGFNTFTALVNRLVFEYVEKNRELLERK